MFEIRKAGVLKDAGFFFTFAAWFYLSQNRNIGKDSESNK